MKKTLFNKSICLSILSIFSIVCCLFFSSSNIYAEVNYDKKEIKRMEKLINETYNTAINVLGTDHIDMINHPLDAKDLTTFGVYFLYNNRYDKLQKINESNNCIIPIKMVHRAVKNVFDYHLSTKDIKKQSSKFKFVDDNIILGPSDPGMTPPLKIKKISRDDIGLIRIRAIAEDEIDNNKIDVYKIVLKEKVKDDKRSWRIILIKKIN